MAAPMAPSMSIKIELRIKCQNLPSKDVTSESDPCAVLYLQRQGKFVEIGRTECIKNCSDPMFVKPIEIDYCFEEVQNISFMVFDIDNATDTLDDDDFLGEIKCTLGELVSKSPFQKRLEDKHKKASSASITVSAEEKSKNNDVAVLTFRAQKLDNKDTFGKSDPFLEISKKAPDGSWQTVHRTEVVKNNLNPGWRPLEIGVQTLCNMDFNKEIKIVCFDWDSDGSHDLIGEVTTNVTEMLKSQSGEVMWECINPKKKAKKKSYKNSGVLYLSSCRIVKNYTFLDFVFGGTQINFTVGVDFTGSNGVPTDPRSLHYINPNQPNEYMQAIMAVGSVCQDYDSDKMFPALGFGAQIPPNMEVSHEFALNFNAANPYCAGISGIVAAYQNCIPQIKLYGPTNISPLINHVINFATIAQAEEATKGAGAYYVLLLLTDGIVTDMDQSVSKIVHASNLPMSIIIIGVGEADFTSMNYLDCDDGLLRAKNGQTARRDIVQFVPFMKFKHAGPAELARHVLGEVPKQVTDYFKMRGLAPNPPRQQPPPQVAPK